MTPDGTEVAASEETQTAAELAENIKNVSTVGTSAPHWSRVTVGVHCNLVNGIEPECEATDDRAFKSTLAASPTAELHLPQKRVTSLTCLGTVKDLKLQR